MPFLFVAAAGHCATPELCGVYPQRHGNPPGLFCGETSCAAAAAVCSSGVNSRDGTAAWPCFRGIPYNRYTPFLENPILETPPVNTNSQKLRGLSLRSMALTRRIRGATVATDI